MRQPVTKLINGRKYQVTMLGATEGLDVLDDLLKVLGPAFGALAGGLDLTKGLKEADLKGAAIERAVTALVQSTDKERTKSIIRRLAECTLVDGKPLQAIFEVHFAGAYAELFKWLTFGLEAQFSDFFGGWGGLVKRVGDMFAEGQASTSLNISAGLSGAPSSAV